MRIPFAVLRKAALPFGVLLWLLALASGFRLLAAYSLKPGPVAQDVTHDWPAGLPIAFEPGKCTLLVTLHPECPCSRATVTELERVLTLSPSLRAVAIFEGYDNLPEPVKDSPLWRQAAALQGVQALEDHHGELAHLLGCRTSGEVRVFSGGGHLLFSGGITGSRGHAGANPASDAVISLANGGSSSPALGVPTFGCALDE